MNRFTGIGALALLTSLGSCGSADQPTGDTTPAAEMSMDGPFAQSEVAMDKAMKDAVGVDAADSWVKKMIAHHEGAIDMSRIVLALEPAADVARMAQTTIDNQGAEIETLTALARNGATDPESATLYEAAMKTMHDDMMAASGATPSETYLSKMLAHHRGAVAMSDIALANGAAGPVRAQIEETRSKQLEEVALIEAMLRGEPMRMPAQTSDTASAPTPAARVADPKPAAAKAAPSKAVPAEASPAPAAEPEASPTCEPEHREAGHC